MFKIIKETKTLKEGSGKLRVARMGEFDNGHVFHSWYNWTEEEAQEKAKQASEKFPNEVYYVDEDDIMSDGPTIYWCNGKQCTYEEANKIRNSKTESKILKEDSYEDGIFYEIEEALRDAGMNPSRFVDDGVLTNNIGWTVYGEGGESQQLTCDGSYLSESKRLNENEASLIKALKILFDNSTLSNIKKVAQAKQLAKALNIDETKLIN